MGRNRHLGSLAGDPKGGGASEGKLALLFYSPP